MYIDIVWDQTEEQVASVQDDISQMLPRYCSSYSVQSDCIFAVDWVLETACYDNLN